MHPRAGQPAARGASAAARGAKPAARAAAATGPPKQDWSIRTPHLRNIRHQGPITRLTDENWTRVFSFLDARSLVRWSMTCRRTYLLVHTSILNLIIHPMLALLDISTNFKLWKHAIEKLLQHHNILVPRNRSTYKPFLKEFRRQFKLEPLTGGTSVVTISFDDLPAKQIAFCEPDLPQRHTSKRRHNLPNPRVYCVGLTLGQFMKELTFNLQPQYERDLVVRHASDCVREVPEQRYWGKGDTTQATRQLVEDESGQVTFRGNRDSMAPLCLFHFLKAVVRCCLAKEEGQLVIRRVELFSDTNIDFHHRVWLQLMMGWPKLDKEQPRPARPGATDDELFKASIAEYENQLYLSVCDHFRWTS